MARHGCSDDGDDGAGTGCRLRRHMSTPPAASSDDETGFAAAGEAMGAPGAPRKPSVAEPAAAWLSRLMFQLVEPLMSLGGMRRMKLEDLPPLDAEIRSEQASRRFRAAYLASNKHVLKAIWRTEWRAILCSGGLQFCAVVCGSYMPVLLLELLTLVMNPAVEGSLTSRVLLLLVELQLSLVLRVVFDRHARFRMFKAHLRAVLSIRRMIFEKSIEKPVQGRHGTSTSIAAIATLYSSHLEQVSWLLVRFHDFWASSAQLGVLLYILNRTLHTSASVISGSLGAIVGFLVLLSFLSAKTFKWYTKKRAKTLAAVNECFKGIQSIKMHAWEDKILSKIMHARNKEQRRQWWEGTFRVLRFCCIWEAHAFASVGVLLSLASQAEHFSPATVFTVLILIDLIRVELHGVVKGVRVFIDGNVGLRKIVQYLHYCEMFTTETEAVTTHKTYPENVVVAVEHAFIPAGKKPKDEVVLANVNLRVTSGEMVVVHGKAGAGKSTLLSAILREAACVRGSVYVSSEVKVAYCSEDPWLQTLSVKDNVVFGSDYDEEKYCRVLEACCLLDDLERLPDGEDTMIGPKGINLSGGQKSRIALARALYSDADLYILDRPLASADAIVQSDVFRKCFLELLRYKTLIVATHNPEVISSGFVDRLWHVNDSSVIETCRSAGTPPSSGSGGFSRRARRLADIPPWRTANASSRTESPSSHASSFAMEDTQVQNALKRISRRQGMGERPDMDPSFEKTRRDMAELARETTWEKGGWKHSLVASGFFLVYGAVEVGKNLWLVHWTKMTWTWVAMRRAAFIYAVLNAASFLTILVGSILVFRAVSQRSSRMFFDVTFSLLRAPMSVLYRIPIGEILARYSKDMQTGDIVMGFQLVFLFRSIVTTLGALGTVCYALGATGVVISAMTAHAARMLVDKRLFAQVYTLRAALDTSDMTFVSEALDGAAVIRAFGSQQLTRIFSQQAKMTDELSQISSVSEMFTHWLLIRSSLTVSAFLLLLVIVLRHGGMHVSVLGVVLHCICNLQRDFIAFSVGILNTSVDMLSLANLQKYQRIPPEERSDSSCSTLLTTPPTPWPTDGAIIFDHAWFKYGSSTKGSEDVFALKDVSFAVAGGERIGVVGRTGSGKSSLAMALLRVHELPHGRILIDGVDISRLRLRDLRSRVCIIPQTPLFYRASIRRYLDPFKEFEDAALWKVLAKTGLCDEAGRDSGEEPGDGVGSGSIGTNRVVVTSLDERLAENGENWSMGQRQMLVLARSLLKPARVLILDEAFSSVDQECDQRLLRIVEKQFASSTIFLITHRLDQVLGFDRIVVMENGTVAEYGAAEELVGNPDSAFYEFLETTLLTY